MGLQKEVFDHLTDFSENRISEKVLFTHINSLLPIIWHHGLSEDNIAECLKIFTSNQKLDRNTRKCLLQCLVPKQKLLKRTVNSLLLWFFSNVKCPDEAGLVLHWLSVMISNNLIDTEPVDNYFNQLLMCLFIEELTGPTCDVLKNIVKLDLIKPRSIFIVQHYCSLDIKLKNRNKVLYLLRLFYECAPSLFMNPPEKASSYKLSKDKFSESVMQYAFQNRFLEAVPLDLMPDSKKKTKSRNDLSNHMVFNPFAEISGMKELGLRLRSKDISLIDINSAVGSKEGLIYLCWHHSLGWGFPKETPATLEILDRLLNVCRRVKSGLNFIPTMISSYLLSWDGEENYEVIYELISWIHFESFEDLYKHVLYYIVNLYITGTVSDKTRIIYCLTKLIANKVSTTAREVTVLLISLVSNLIKVGLCSTNLQSSLLLMASVRFYKYLSLIEERYMLGTWTVAPPYVVFGAVFSECFVLISEICSLVVRYFTVMHSKFTSLGLIDKFAEEEEIVKVYLKDLHLFLWQGQARKTEFVASEENESPIGSLAAGFDSVFTVRNHAGIAPLVSFLALQLGRNPKDLTDEDLMKMFKSYCEGLFFLNKTHLESDSRIE